MSQLAISIESLEIAGHAGLPLANRYFHTPTSIDLFGVVFPGLRYNCDKPLLHFTTQALLARGANVLQVWADYSRPEVQNLDHSKQTLWMLEDASAAVRAVLAIKLGGRLVLAGKSIGTLVMALLLAERDIPEPAATIWLTPLLQIPSVAQAIQSSQSPTIVAGGTADSAFDPQMVQQFESLPHLHLLRVDGANHSLEIRADPRRSIAALAKLVDRIMRLQF